MNRNRKLALGIAAVATLAAGGIAVAAPALAQDDPPPPTTVECPYDGDGLTHQNQYGPYGQQEQAQQPDQTGQQDQIQQRDRDGTCQLADDEDSQS